MTTGSLPPDGPDRHSPARVRPYVPGTEPPPPEAPTPAPVVRDPKHQAAADHALLRPYLMTGGRVAPISGSLEIEAQVVTTELGRGSREAHTFEARDIVELCGAPLSIAEAAARLGLQVGVVRVLVGDLLGMGHLEVLRPEVGLSTDVETIEKVIRGLQSIS